jgi:hypothetical protein
MPLWLRPRKQGQFYARLSERADGSKKAIRISLDIIFSALSLV